jgi:membrane fusion protein (multidrug efflux system)
MKNILKALGVVLVCVAVVLALHRRFGSPQLPKRPPLAGNKVVKAERAALRPFATRVEALGTAEANESITVTAPVSERIAAILFTNGAVVEAGQKLVQLENAEELAQAREAEVSLAERRRELERVRSLRDKQMVSEQELDSSQTAAEAAEARLAAAEARLKDRAITAPFAGVLGIRRVSPGSLVGPGTAITTLDDVDPIKADFAVPERLLSAVEPGLAVEVASAAWPGETFTGVLVTVDSRVHPATRAITAQALLPNPRRRLRGGMFLTVALICRPRNAIGIPEKAVIAYSQNHYVFAVRADSTVERREIELGERENGWVEVTAGLAEDQTIVVDGLMDLRDGDRIQVAGETTATGAEPSPASPR